MKSISIFVLSVSLFFSTYASAKPNKHRIMVQKVFVELLENYEKALYADAEKEQIDQLKKYVDIYSPWMEFLEDCQSKGELSLPHKGSRVLTRPFIVLGRLQGGLKKDFDLLSWKQDVYELRVGDVPVTVFYSDDGTMTLSNFRMPDLKPE